MNLRITPQPASRKRPEPYGKQIRTNPRPVPPRLLRKKGRRGGRH